MLGAGILMLSLTAYITGSTVRGERAARCSGEATLSMMSRVCSPLTIMLFACLTGGFVTPGRGIMAQALDSTGMPPLELLAQAAGRESRRHPVRAVAPAMLCEEGHPLVDSASVAACANLAGLRAVLIVAAFAKGLELPLAPASDTSGSAELPSCPADIERKADPRVLLARVTAPVVGVREGVWEGRLTMELRCRAAKAGSRGGIATLGKSYLYQWSGHEWKMYQFSWWRDERE